MVWNWAHMHLILNHIPVIVMPLATILLAIAIWRQNASIALTADWLFASTSVIAGLVYGSGFFAEDYVVQQSIANHDVISPHHDAALYALLASIIVGLWSGAMILRRRVHHELSDNLQKVSVAAGFAATMLLAWTANAGGKILHTEIRPEGWEDSLESDHSQLRPGLQDSSLR